MTITGRILVSVAIAALVSIALAYLQTGGLPDPALICAFLIATVATALLTNLHQGPAATPAGGGTAATPTGGGTAIREESRRSAVAAGPREQGKVKWFNVSKGFGFITKDDGEEIFVHFRSIRGDGRRSLRDGQRVSFVVARSEKGPQAEDVEAL